SCYSTITLSTLFSATTLFPYTTLFRSMENELETLRYIEKIEDSENNRALFSHRFPVEISVPLYRVANLNDVAVSIESFDYELPQPNHLKLKSTIDIHGISEEQRTEEVKENKIDEERNDKSE